MLPTNEVMRAVFITGVEDEKITSICGPDRIIAKHFEGLLSHTF